MIECVKIMWKYHRYNLVIKVLNLFAMFKLFSPGNDFIRVKSVSTLKKNPNGCKPIT